MSPDFPQRLHEVIGSRVHKPSIGDILTQAGRLATDDAERIAQAQQQSNLSFGEAGVRLGLLSRADIDFALARQYEYPYLDAADGTRISTDLVAALQPFSMQTESLRALRSQLALRWLDHAGLERNLAVVGPQRGDGRSWLAANLAIVFAQLGQRTLLIDADMRHPRQHQLFALSNGNGLSSILSGRRHADSIRRYEPLANLSVLSAGPQAPNPQELLGRNTFAELLAECSSAFDVVLIDTPAGNDYADAQIVCARAGSAMLTARRNRTRLNDAGRLSSDLQRHGVKMLGAVLSEF